jgi:ribosome maturation factor RimP
LGWWVEGWAVRPFFICGGGLKVLVRAGRVQVESIIEQAVSGLGFDLVDIETSPKGRLLRVFIDAPSGISVDDCARVSNHLTRLFAVENVDYDRLEVSSPGLDRPLKKLTDFERFAGQQAQVRIRVAIAGQRNFAGVLEGVDDGKVLLVTDKGKVAFGLDQIDKARLVPKF